MNPKQSLFGMIHDSPQMDDVDRWDGYHWVYHIHVGKTMP
jgi:hypothetical protein